eukprot:786836-Pleurochrysis_carterae.AAC.6
MVLLLKPKLEGKQRTNGKAQRFDYFKGGVSLCFPPTKHRKGKWHARRVLSACESLASHAVKCYNSVR